MEPEEEPPICEWCNKPVKAFGDLCENCEKAQKEADRWGTSDEDGNL